MSGIVDPPVIAVQTVKITRYDYGLSSLIPHTSVQYNINCYNEDVYVKTISGLLEGTQYIEWVNDDYLDAFIKAKVEELGIK